MTSHLPWPPWALGFAAGALVTVGAYEFVRSAPDRHELPLPVVCRPRPPSGACYDGKSPVWFEEGAVARVKVPNADGYYETFVVGWKEKPIPE